MQTRGSLSSDPQDEAPEATFRASVPGGNGWGSAPDQLTRPHAVAVDSDGNLYALDTYNVRECTFGPRP